MGNFRKNRDCPSSEAILAFVSRLATTRTGDVARHLVWCEFCRAEAEFYRSYPPVHENVVADKIPAPLHELADALLRKTADVTTLNRLIERG